MPIDPARPERQRGELRAVLFDLDGLLIDSEPIWFRVEERVLAELGGARPWRHEDQAACVGGTLPLTADYLRGLARMPVSNAEVQRRLLTGMAAALRGPVPLRPGALELLRALASDGVPCALVSSSYRVLVDAALGTIGPEHFAISVAGDEVRRPKPDPEPYRTAARRLDVEPSACVVFEDAPAGVASAEAAGCVCVVVPDVVPVPQTPTRPVLGSLLDVELDWLRRLPALLAPVR